MTSEWRIINLGEIEWIETQAIYHALSLVQDEHDTPNTLIINWPSKPFVCIGLHQIMENSVELDYINSQKLPIVRRGCGGGSVYLDSNQVFYQIICKKEEYNFSLKEFYQFFLDPVVKTYRFFDIPAEYSPINDIVAEEKKISGNGAVTFGRSRVLVGNFIFDFPAKEMSKILKVPEEKFRDKIANSLEERMGSFSSFLDTPPSKKEVIQKYIEFFHEKTGKKLETGKLSEIEKEKIKEIKALYEQNEWLNYVEYEKDSIIQQKILSGTYFTFSERKFQGGLVQLFIHFEGDVIADLVISGDFTVSPPMILPEFQSYIIGAKVNRENLRKKLEMFSVTKEVDLPGITIDDLVELFLDTYKKVKK
jgi:lipoate-protein ligase A